MAQNGTGAADPADPAAVHPAAATAGGTGGPPAGGAGGARFATVRMLSRGWWLFLLRGAVSIVFGILALLVPGAGLTFILLMLAFWLLSDGFISVVQAVRGRPHPAEIAGLRPAGGRSRAWLGFDGVLSILLGLAVLLLPALSAVALAVMFGAWSIAIGIGRVVVGVRARDALLGLLGAVMVLAGLWILLAPGAGLLALVWLVAIQAIAMGVLFLGLGWRLRRVAHDPHGPETEGAATARA